MDIEKLIREGVGKSASGIDPASQPMTAEEFLKNFELAKKALEEQVKNVAISNVQTNTLYDKFDPPAPDKPYNNDHAIDSLVYASTALRSSGGVVCATPYNAPITAGRIVGKQDAEDFNHFMSIKKTLGVSLTFIFKAIANGVTIKKFDGTFQYFGNVSLVLENNCVTRNTYALLCQSTTSPCVEYVPLQEIGTRYKDKIFLDYRGGSC